MKPNYVLQCLTSDKYGRITMLEQPNVRWIMEHVERFKLDLPAKRYSISAKEIGLLQRDLSSFIVQSGVKKSLVDFDPNYEAIIFIYTPATGKYSPKAYRPAVNGKENFML